MGPVWLPVFFSFVVLSPEFVLSHQSCWPMGAQGALPVWQSDVNRPKMLPCEWTMKQRQGLWTSDEMSAIMFCFWGTTMSNVKRETWREIAEAPFWVTACIKCQTNIPHIFVCRENQKFRIVDTMFVCLLCWDLPLCLPTSSHRLLCAVCLNCVVHHTHWFNVSVIA